MEGFCAEAWLKSYSSITKQNLNSEIKEKEMNNKRNVMVNCAKTDNGSQFSSFPPNLSQGKLENFIDNKRPFGMKGIKNKIINETSNEACIKSTGIGRGILMQKKAQNSSGTHLYNAPHLRDLAMDTLAAPISSQLDELFGDIYSEATLRRHLQEMSSQPSDTRVPEPDNPPAEPLDLERPLNNMTLQEGATGGIDPSFLWGSCGPDAWVPSGSSEGTFNLETETWSRPQ